MVFVWFTVDFASLHMKKFVADVSASLDEDSGHAFGQLIRISKPEYNFQSKQSSLQVCGGGLRRNLACSWCSLRVVAIVNRLVCVFSSSSL